MATGFAGHIAREIERPVYLGYWSEVFDNNPYMNTNGVYIRGNNPSEMRPYVLGSLNDRLLWNPNHRAIPGEVFLRPHERKTPGDYWIIEPNVKATYSSNKNWGFDRWQRVAEALRPHVTLVQFNGPYLHGVERVQTDTFRKALGYMEASRGFVGPEGGLHHAAAAFKRPAVVLFGGYIHPRVTGYDGHTNLGGGFCGRRRPCQHCKKELEKITVDEVVRGVRDLL